MSKKQVLLLFASAGVILAAVLGVYFYRSNLGPSTAEVSALLQTFTEKIASGALDEARQLMTEDTRALLRDPGTVLGETVYRELRLKSTDSVRSEGDGRYTADVVFTTPDTMKIMTKAGMLFAEKVTEEGPADDTDQAIADIYTEILSRDDLPTIDNFCVVRLELQNGQLYIRGDAALQQALEGGMRVELQKN